MVGISSEVRKVSGTDFGQETAVLSSTAVVVCAVALRSRGRRFAVEGGVDPVEQQEHMILFLWCRAGVECRENGGT